MLNCVVKSRNWQNSMVISRYGWVKDGMIPFVEVDGLTFHGIPQSEYPLVFDQIVRDIKERYWANRPYPQHKHYDYKPGDTVVEVGAYLGYYAMNVAPKAGQVLAIEMIPELYRIMCMNLEPYANAKTVLRGVSNEQGVGVARKGDRQGSSLVADVANHFSTVCQDVEVELDTLDNILDDNKINEVDCMIIQVNGSELEVLEGLTLKRVKNFVIATPYTEEGVVKDVLVENGFKTKGDKIMVYGHLP